MSRDLFQKYWNCLPKSGALTKRARKIRQKALERLESRRLLTSDVANSFNDSDATAAEWFGEYPQAELVRQRSIIGPIDFTRAPTNWIVDFTPAALDQLEHAHSVDEFFSDAHLPLIPLRGLGQPGVLLAESSDVLISEVREALAASPLVEHFEVDQILAASETYPPGVTLFDQQLGLNSPNVGAVDINAPQAWDTTTGSADTVIAVIDSGVNSQHPDLVNNLWNLTQEPNYASIRASLLAEPATAPFANANQGFNFVSQNGNIADDNGHGTAVAGIIGAQGDDGTGVTGVLWDTKILPVKYLNQANQGALSNAIASINYVTLLKNLGVNIRAINASWGFYGDYSPELRDAIAAAGKADILFVAASGNGGALGLGINLDRDRVPFYPASFDLDNVISVGASNVDGSLAYFSNYGASSVDVVAPGTGILTTDMNGGYSAKHGTSFAAPFVTGTAGLLATAKPLATATEYKDAILSSATKLPALTGKVVSGGVVNAAAALNAQTFAPTAELTSVAVNGQSGSDVTNFSVSESAQIKLDVTYQASGFDLLPETTSSALTIRRLGWQGFVKPVQIVGVPQSANNRTAITSYAVQIADATENGEYEIVLQGNSVRDASGSAARERVIGRFHVTINSPNVIAIDSFDDFPAVNGLISPLGANGKVSLRSAMMWANLNQSNANLTFLLRDGTYTLTSEVTATYTDENGDLDVHPTFNRDVKLLGSGQEYAIIQNRVADRVFQISSGSLTLEGVTVSGGKGPDYGGGIDIDVNGTVNLIRSTVSNNSAALSGGGGIANRGTLNMQESTVDSNSAPRATRLGGGGVYNAGTATIHRSTISNNTTEAGFTGVGGGGGIFTDTGGVTYIYTSTVSGNTAPRGKGGGVYNIGYSDINHATITNNNAAVFPGVYNEPGLITPLQYDSSFGASGPDIDEWGNLDSPRDMAINDNNVNGISTVYLVDTDNNRILVFEPGRYPSTSHAFRFSFGKFGSGPGEFNTPTSIAVSDDGSLVFVSDSNNNRVQVFNSLGEYQYQINGPTGGITGRLSLFENKIAVATNNGIFVCDLTGVNRTPYLTLGFNSSFYNPSSTQFAITSDRLYAKDQFQLIPGQSQVRVYDLTGAELNTAFSNLGNIDSSVDYSLRADRNLFIPDYHGTILLVANGFLNRYDADGNFIETIQNVGALNGDLLHWNISEGGNFYYFTRASESTYQLREIYGSYTGFDITGRKNDAIAKKAIAVSPTGDMIAVADVGSNRVRIFDSNHQLQFTLPVTPSLNSSNFDSPRGLAIDAAHNIYVADPGNSRVRVFGSTGALIRDISVYATSLAVDSQGRMYVINGGSQVQVFDGNGFQLPSNFPFFGNIAGVAVDQNGKSYFLTENFGQVFIFNEDYSLHSITEPLPGLIGDFRNASITVDGLGRIYIADDVHDKLWIQEQNGSFVDYSSIEGLNLPLHDPQSVAAPTEATGLYLADSSDRVQYYSKATPARRTTIANSIVARNASQDDNIGGDVRSFGNNLFTQVTRLVHPASATGSLDNTSLYDSRISPVDPKLGPLLANGGYTKTHALLTGSPAIDKAETSLPIINGEYPQGIDQTGRIAKKVGFTARGTADIGAYELFASKVKGRVFQDSNGNGILDVTEGGLPGVQLFLDSFDANHDGIPQPFETGNGLYDVGEPITTTLYDDPTTPLINEAGTFEFNLSSRFSVDDYHITLLTPVGHNFTSNQVNAFELPFSFTKIADTTSPITINGSSQTFGRGYYSSIDDEGNVVFTASLTDASFTRATAFVTQQNHFQQVDIGGAADYVHAENSLVIDDGTFTFGSNGPSYPITYSGSNFAKGVWQRDANGQIRPVAFDSSIDPESPTGSPFGPKEIGNVGVNRGKVYFNAGLPGTPRTDAIYAGTNDIDLFSIVNSADDSGTPAGTFDEIRDFVLKGEKFAFVTDNGVYSAILGNVPQRNVDRGSGLDFGEFGESTVALTDNSVAFSTAGSGVYLSPFNASTHTTIADSLTPIPAGNGTFTYFDPRISADGDLVVLHGFGGVNGQGIPQEGLYLYRVTDNPNPFIQNLFKLIDTSDTINGLHPTAFDSQPGPDFAHAFRISRDAIAGNKITFTATLSDGRDVVMVAEIPQLSRQDFILSAGSERDNVNFGLRAVPGSISGNAFKDVNINGVRDAGEVAQANVTIYLDQNNNGQRDPGEQFTRTDANGHYEFTDLGTPTNYVVRQETPTDFTQVFPNTTQDYRWSVVVNPGQELEGYDFGYIPSNGSGGVGNNGILRGRVNLEGGSGQQGWTVYLDNQNTTTTTNATGDYVFTGVSPGTHRVRLVSQANRVTVNPLSNRFVPTVPLASASNTFPNEPGAVEVGNFDGANGNDVAVISRTGNAVSFLMNQGSGVLNSAVQIVTGANWQTSSLVPGDFNNDGKLDVAVGNFSASLSTNFMVLLNNGASSGVPFTSGSGLPAPSVPGATQALTRDMVKGDFNRDGFLDIATAQAGGTNNVLVFLNQAASPGNFNAPQQLSVLSNNYAIAAIQLNDDDGNGVINDNDYLDLAVASFSLGTIQLLRNNGAGVFSAQGSPIPAEGRADPQNSWPVSLDVGDYDQDGKPDLAVGNYNTPSVTILRSSGNFGFTITSNIAVSTGVVNVVAADIDNDGDLDMAVSASGPSSDPNDPGVVILRNLGQGRFSAPTSTGVGTLGDVRAYYVATGDIDRNNTVDLVVTDGFHNRYAVLVNEIVAEGEHVVQLVTGAETINQLDFMVRDKYTPTPTSVQFAPASDSGWSTSDGITKFNNSDAANNWKFTVTGTVSGALVSVFLNGVIIGSTVASSATTTVTATIGLPGTTGVVDGAYIVTATQKEANKLESPPTANFSIRIDTVVPPTPAAPVLTAASDDGSSSSDKITSLTTLTFTGAANKGDVVTLYRNNVVVSTQTATGTSYAFTLGDFTEGTWTMKVGITDAAGNVGANSATSTVQVVPPLGFAVRRGSTGTLNDEGRGVAIDGAGNVYVAGSLGAMDNNDDGPGTGVGDVVVVAYSPTGASLWTFNPVTANLDDRAFAITTAVEGSNTFVYITGMFSGTLPVAPAPNLVSAGGTDIFVIKLRATDGGVMWAKSLGGATTSLDKGMAITVDESGAIWVTGQFIGQLASPNLTIPGAVSSAGNADIFVMKLSKDGGLANLYTRGGTGIETGMSIITDGANNVFVAGFATSNFSFDPGNPGNTSAQFTVRGAQDGFLWHFANNGDFRFATVIGGSDATLKDAAYGLALDQSQGTFQGVYVVGAFGGTNVDFDPSPTTATLLSSKGNLDAYVAKFDRQGALLWAKSAGGTSVDRARGVVVQPNQTIAVTGAFSGTVDFDPGTATVNLVAQGVDAFLWRLGSAGAYLSANKFGGTGTDYGRGICRDAAGNMVLAGMMGTSFTANNFVLTSAGGQDMFAIKVTQFAITGLPKLSSIPKSLAYVEGASPEFTAPAAFIADSDSANFNTGYLQVKVYANATADDRLTIEPQGDAAGQVNVVSANVKYGGVIIGVWNGGQGNTPLRITFNAAATPASVQAVLRRIAFAVLGTDPSVVDRTLAFSLVDDTGKVSDTLFQTMRVQAVNGAAVVDGLASTLSYQLNATAPVSLAPAATLSDDNGNLAGAALRVKFAAGGSRYDRILLEGGFQVKGRDVERDGVVVGTLNSNGGIGTTALLITFTNQANLDTVQDIIRALKFQTVGGSSKLTRTVAIHFKDSQGRVSEMKKLNITVE